MKKQIFKITSILFLGIAAISCKETKNETEATKAEEVKAVEATADRYTADIENSTLAWKGFKPTGTHNGTVKISEGYVVFDKGNLTGGNFVFDMNAITVLDIESADDNNAKLTGHLKSPDFFDVENHAFSSFDITGVEEKDGKTWVKGNLSIKNIKKNIEFPVEVTVIGDEALLKSEPFTIDRTEWDIKYKSTKFFDDLKDKFINDGIEIAIDVKAKKS